MPQATRDITAYEIQERIARLRRKAEDDPAAAAEQAAAWLAELADTSRTTVADVATRLGHVFRAGSAEPAEGLAEVTLVVVAPGGPGALARAAAGRWSPLRAKHFSPGGGTNVLHPLAGLPAALLLGGSRHPRGCGTLRFRSRVEPSVAEPGLAVVALDLGAGARIGSRLVGRVRDEMVQIVPGVHLLRAYLKAPGGRWVSAPVFEILRVVG